MAEEDVHPEINNGAMFERPGRSAPFMRGAQLLAILQSERAFTGAQLAKQLGVDLRTLRRYIEELRGLGFLVESYFGHYGGYKLARGTVMPPLMLSDYELETLIGALSYSQHPNDDFKDRAAELEGRINRLVPAKKHRRMSDMSFERFSETLKNRPIKRD